MIPRKKFYRGEYFTYITESLFLEYHSQNDWRVFMEWMYGQTCPIVKNKMAIYSWDYERWVSQGKKTKQGKDWD